MGGQWLASTAEDNSDHQILNPVDGQHSGAGITKPLPVLLGRRLTICRQRGSAMGGTAQDG